MRLPAVILYSLCAAVPGAAIAQGLPFPVDTFSSRELTAERLLAYDACGWKSSDELVKRPQAELAALGPLWLCFQDAGAWHAVYGLWTDSAQRFDVRVHYRIDSGGVQMVTTPMDTASVSRRVRALSTTLAQAPAAFTKGRARFNFYVLPERDSSLAVWLLPAWQSDGTALFGAELTYKFSPDGGELLGTSVIPGPIRGTRPDSTAPFRIDSNSPDSPAVGDI